MKPNHKYNLIHYFKSVVEEYGNNICLESKDKTYTFNEVDKLSERVASYIKEHIQEKNQPIPVHLKKSCEAVIVFIGVLKSGNFYIPLDISSPEDRKKSILQTLKSKIIISDQLIFEELYDNFLLEKLLNNSITLFDKDNLTISTKPAYTIFTSGSTGIPKGVVVSHQSVIDYIFWAQSIFNTSNKTIIGSQAPFYFDNSVLDIYQMMLLGARLVVVPEEYYTFPTQLLDFIEQRKINFIFWVPSALVSISKFNALENKNLPHLKEIVFAGEVMPTKHLNYWRKNLSKDTNYTNLYGPTEITVDCTYYKVERNFEDNEILPIGIQCENTEIILLDESKNIITKSNIQGEICVTGVGLALGYFGNTDKSKDSFIQTPQHNNYRDLIYMTGDFGYYNENTEIIFVGRKDNQIKFQGYRIELGEIENKILEIKGIDQVCVLFDSDKKKILCFYEGKIEEKALLQKLKPKLPKYMVPKQFKKTVKLPLNQNGKIDRIKLISNE